MCGKLGHEALQCYHLFDHSYQLEDCRVAAAAITSYAVDPNRYADTGAIDHLTSDLDRLTVSERYNGSD